MTFQSVSNNEYITYFTYKGKRESCFRKFFKERQIEYHLSQPCFLSYARQSIICDMIKIFNADLLCQIINRPNETNFPVHRDRQTGHHERERSCCRGSQNPWYIICSAEIIQGKPLRGIVSITYSSLKSEDDIVDVHR